MTAPLLVVLDTNVVLSALVFGGGTAGRLRGLWPQGVLVPLASTATAQELVRVLAYPNAQRQILTRSTKLKHNLLLRRLPKSSKSIAPQHKSLKPLGGAFKPANAPCFATAKRWHLR